ncbi:DUF4232 domain-containing protein [Actinokineospora sp. NBRC 105648]|uniref:DUF4232 domain-containing protein n=1 Tax=Actinokineospora sp. NBRC 105648 TaxID=3032206 RepID=UPI00255328E5|nr:DUF4232 domain-containing protein [Actinokineospora sp. NBRC 105648]
MSRFLLLLVPCVLAAACVPTESAQPDLGATSTTAVTTTARPTAAPEPVPAAQERPTRGRTRPCRGSDLAVTLENWRPRERTSDGATVVVAVDYRLRNEGADPCTVQGWPELTLYTATGPLEAHNSRLPGDTPVITLPRGADTTFSASFKHCLARATGVRLRLPDDPDPVPVPSDEVPACVLTDIAVTPFGRTL